MKALHMLAFVLVIVGALNWGLVGVADFNLVNKILGSWEMIEKIVYILVGLSAVYLALTHKHDCKHCESKPMGTAM